MYVCIMYSTAGNTVALHLQYITGTVPALLLVLYSNFIGVKWEKETLFLSSLTFRNNKKSSKNSLIFHSIFSQFSTGK